MLREVRLDRVDALGVELGDPRLGEIVFDAMEDAAIVHGTMIDQGADGCMSRSAHLYGPESSF